MPVDAANGRPSRLAWARLIWPLAGAARMRLAQEAGARRGPLSGILPDCERCTPVRIGDSLSDKWVISYFWHEETEPATFVSRIRGSPEGMTIASCSC